MQEIAQTIPATAGETELGPRELGPEFEAAVLNRYHPDEPHHLQPVANALLENLRRKDEERVDCWDGNATNTYLSNPDGIIVTQQGKVVVVEAKYLVAKSLKHRGERQGKGVPPLVSTALRAVQSNPSLAASLGIDASPAELGTLHYDPSDPTCNRVVGPYSEPNLAWAVARQGLVEHNLESGVVRWAVDLLDTRDGEVEAVYEGVNLETQPIDALYEQSVCNEV